MTSYNDLVNIPTFGKKKEEFSSDRGEVAFYCRDCQKVVDAVRLNPNKYIYECPECKGRKISIGTINSLGEFYSKKR